MSLESGPAANDEVRRRNTALVMRLLRDSGALSRSDLARRSGLAKATVGTIIGQLQQAGAVAEGTAEASGRGRPSTPVALTGHTLAGLGIEVNVDYVATTAIDLAGRRLSFEERVINRPQMADVVRLVREEVARLEAEGITLLGLTVAVPGLIDRVRGVVVEAPNLGWTDVDLARSLREELDGRIEVAVDNDANCAARAESLHGVAAGVNDFVYLTGTVGLGAGHRPRRRGAARVARAGRRGGPPEAGRRQPPLCLRTQGLLGSSGRAPGPRARDAGARVGG